MLLIFIRPNHKTEFSAINPPLGLGYLASCLRKAGHKVAIIDCVLLKWDNEKLINKLTRFHKTYHIDALGISSLTSYYLEVKDLTKKLKINPALKKVPLILGGIHASFLPEITIKETKADFIVIGEGEHTIVELIENINDTDNYKHIKGICYLNENDDLVVTPSQDYIMDLDEIPFPSWDLMDPNWYPPRPFGTVVKKTPIAPILTTRGCPYQCTFCASKNFWGPKLRKRSPKNVVDEIELLNHRYKVKEFHIWDDNFTLNNNHAIEICKEIIRRELKINLALPNGIRLDQIDNKLLYYLQKVGMYSITVAIESGNQRILDLAKKNLNLAEIPYYIQKLKKMRVLIMAFFILGLPGENIASLKDTISFSTNLKIDRCAFFIASPIPGSELFELWLKREKFSKKDLFGYDWNKILFIGGIQNSLCDLDYHTLQRFQKHAYRIFIKKHLKNYILIAIKFFKIRQLSYRLNQILFFFLKKNYSH